MTHSKLRAVMDDLARTSLPAVVNFHDGEVLELRIVSTIHAEEGEDFVAELLQTLVTKAAIAMPGGSMLNIDLADVESVLLDGQCIFRPDGNS
jgi:hypothetical protein